VVLDPGVCRRAAASRDPRFDGRFLVGVRTTGVYCRPHCPGTARPENVRYYASREEARADGLRACLRCRPDADSWRSGSRPLCRARGRGRVVLQYDEPLDWCALLGFLADRVVAGVEEVDGGTVRRAVRTSAGPMVVEVARCAPGKLELRAERPRDAAVAARRAFDLDASPEAIASDLGEDPLLGPLVARRPGLRVPGAWDAFELVVRAVLGQQVSVAAARTLAGRLVARFGEPLACPAGAVTHAFPDALALAGAPVEEIGLPRARAAAVRTVSTAVLDGRLDLGERDPELLRMKLLALPGVGPWTAEYVAMRALGDPDAMPAADLGVRHALAAGGAVPPAREVELRSRAWRPWRAYAVLHLWTALGERARDVE
jgi:AraC family transcriptional regulator of adaptative response / DNA-3-methyladenine glycosylase II